MDLRKYVTVPGGVCQLGFIEENRVIDSEEYGPEIIIVSGSGKKR